MVNSFSNNNYSFPGVTFSESVVGPLPFASQWRNTIGVAGVFAKGPAIARVRNREEFAYLYGEDDSRGSLFIREAMLQGASDFFISRVMPNNRGSVGTLFLQGSSGTGQIVDGNLTHNGGSGDNLTFVGEGDSRTVGLSFTCSYIGSPIIPVGSYIGADITTESDEELTIPGFNGVGYFDFKIVEKVSPSNVTPSSAISISVIETTSENKVQIVSLSGAQGSTLRNNAKPGLLLKATSAVAGYPADGLKILSYPSETSEGTYEVFVLGDVGSNVPASVDVTIEAEASSDPDYFTLSYAYRSFDGASLPATAAATRTYVKGGSSDGFFTVSGTVKTSQKLSFINEEGSGLYSQVKTGINISIGNLSSTSTTELVPGTGFSIPFIYSSVSVGETDTEAEGFPNTTKSFNSGLAAVEILNNLKRAIALNEILSRLVDTPTVNDSLLPHSLSFESAFKGKESNRILFKLTRTVGQGNPQDLLFGQNGSLYNTAIGFSSGQDSMGTASMYLYDANGNPLVYLQALSPGAYGNNIRVNVRPQSPGGFRLEIYDESSERFEVPVRPESFTLSNYNVDPNTGMYTETLSSNIIRAYFVPVITAGNEAVPKSTYDLTPQRVAPPLQSLSSSPAVDNSLHPSHRGVAYLKGLYLTGGTQPSTFDIDGPDEDDYVDAVRRLEETDCSTISIAGVTISDARYEKAITELLVQSERSTTLNGLRVAVIAAPRGLSEARAETLTAGTSSSRVVVVSGWSTLSGTRYLGTNSLSPEGYYAGNLAVIPPHVSPASVSAGRSIVGPISVDTKNSPQYLDSVTKARVEALYYDPGLKMFKFLNGITTSSDPFERYISIRRTTDQIISDLYRNLQWVRSAPNTRGQRSRVATACDAYLRRLQRDEVIYAYQPTICDESNNTITEISSGQMNVRLNFTPVYPADFIRVQVVRDLSTEFSLSTAG